MIWASLKFHGLSTFLRLQNRISRRGIDAPKGQGFRPSRIQFRTAFGAPLASPCFHLCRCQSSVSKTFSPLSELFTEHTAPELLYLDGPR